MNNSFSETSLFSDLASFEEAGIDIVQKIRDIDSEAKRLAVRGDLVKILDYQTALEIRVRCMIENCIALKIGRRTVVSYIDSLEQLRDSMREMQYSIEVLDSLKYCALPHVFTTTGKQTQKY